MDGISMKSKSLLLTDEVAVPFAAIRSAVRDAGVAEENVVVITQCDSLGGKLSNDLSSFEAVVTLSKAPEFLGPKWLAEISRVLVPGGRIFVQTSIVTDENIDKTRAALERKLLIAGFVEVQAVDSVGSVAIKGRKASWTIGSSFAIKKVAKTMPKIQIDADMDLIDEDSLLTEEDLKKPQLPVVGDCEVGATRKACKNCTCGRAEEEEKVLKLELTAEQINNPKSACGSCGLGDAFRCGGCPYKGLPPFKIGEKVTLSGNFLVDDF